MNERPKRTFRAGACSASVFINERQTENGTFKLPSIAFSCRYKDETSGEWKDASSMSPNEAARALIVLRKALDDCLVRESEPASAPTSE